MYATKEASRNTEELNIFRSVDKIKWCRERGQYGLVMKKLEMNLSRVSHQDNPFLYNMILNEIEMTQKKTFLESRPRQLGVNLTHNCNIRCRMCFYPNSPWDIPESTVSQIKEYLPYLQRVFWQGGEPFFSPYFNELFDKSCGNPHLRQTIITNGLLIDEDWAKKLVSNKVTIVFSIDGITKETYDYIRSGAKYENLIGILETLNKHRKEYFRNTDICPYNFETIMQVTVMKYNYRQIAGFLDFAKKYGFDALNIIPIQNVFGPENIFYHKDSQALEYLADILPKMQRQARHYRIRFQNQLPQPAGQNSQAGTPGPGRCIGDAGKDNPRLESDALSCYWPWYSLFILFEGRVKPYGFCKNDVEWDLKDHSLPEIWNNRMMQTYRRKIIERDNADFCESRCVSGIIAKKELGLEMK
jgi:MoaA/NifB/PqqE/SkfB family radical SAM enzyme